MAFKLHVTPEAKAQMKALSSDEKKVQKALRLLEANPRHPGLHSHEFTSLSQLLKWKVFEAYAENKTPGAFRIFWHHGPKDGEITILTVTSQP